MHASRALFLILILLLFGGCSPHGSAPQRLAAFARGEEEAAATSDQLASYQIGDAWGKKTLTREDFRRIPALQRIAEGTGRLGGASGFYLGRFGGKHVIATNHHVCPAAVSCLGSTFSLPLLKLSYRLSQFLGTWESIDLTLLAIDVPESDGARLSASANPFAFKLEPYAGQHLITVGFGIAGNPMRRMQANFDRDCRVFSDAVRLLKDPDSINPLSYRTWSFAQGCDVSHGDSGAPVVDRESGEVLGLIWTGTVPKRAEIRDSTYLDRLREEGGSEIWSELSYAVPAHEIGERLRIELERGHLQEPARSVIGAML